MRHSGALRAPPALFAALTWAHPDDEIEVKVAYPDAAERFEAMTLSSMQHGIHALSLQDLDEGALRFSIERSDRHDLRESVATLTVITGLGTDDERILREEVHLDREHRRLVYRFNEGALTQE